MENTKNKTHVNKGIKIQLFNLEEAPLRTKKFSGSESRYSTASSSAYSRSLVTRVTPILFPILQITDTLSRRNTDGLKHDQLSP